MKFEDPNVRATALKRIATLQRLVDDLSDIAAGSRPANLDMDSAVLLRDFRLGAIPLPCLIGYAENHPRLGSKIITTSQLFAMDPEGNWARTLSRFYRLERSRSPRSATFPADDGASE